MFCPACQQETATHKDGSFVLHSRSDGLLCRGTNQHYIDKEGLLNIFGWTFPVQDIWFCEEEHDPLSEWRKKYE